MSSDCHELLASALTASAAALPVHKRLQEPDPSYQRRSGPRRCS